MMGKQDTCLMMLALFLHTGCVHAPTEQNHNVNVPLPACQDDGHHRIQTPFVRKVSQLGRSFAVETLET